MRPQEILGLLLRAFGIWLLVTGLIHLPAAIGSILYLANLSIPAMPSHASETIAAANERIASLRGGLREAMWWPAITELVRISAGVVLLAGANRWVGLLYPEPKRYPAPMRGIDQPAEIFQSPDFRDSTAL